MNLESLEKPIKSFFDRCNKEREESVIVFTTFGLDETALYMLLKHFKVRPKQRVVVFHEIMKHMSPGFLKAHVPNSITIAIELNGHIKSKCPVFHSKIWMLFRKKPFECLAAAIHSINLTRFHLDSESSTLENFVFIEKKIELARELTGKESIFNKERIFNPRSDSKRLKLKPGTFILDATKGMLKLELTNRPASQIIKNILKDRNSQILGCGAPFIKKKAILDLIDNESRPKVWSNQNCLSGNDNEGRIPALHAKVIELEKHIISGSPNLTLQGMGTHGVVNHETIVITKKHERITGLKKYKMDLDDANEVDNEQYDTNMPGAKYWPEEKALAVNGPDRVWLDINNQKAIIYLVGDKLKHSKQVLIFSEANDKKANSLKSGIAKKSKSFMLTGISSRNKQRELLEILLFPPVWVRGTSKDGKWKKELDLGTFWRILEHKATGDNYGFSDGEGISKKKGSRNILLFEDIRKLRRDALDKKITKEINAWYEWIRAFGPPEMAKKAIPEWCITLREDLKRARNV